MALNCAQTNEVLEKFQRRKGDTGSSEVQIALITSRIERLTQHLKENKHDFHSRRGLLKLVSQRRKLLDYFKRKSLDGYKKLIAELGLRR